MLHWIKTSDKLPDNPNSLKNNCLVRTKYDYFFAYYSIYLKIWRRIEVPHRFKLNKILDEIIPRDEVIAWVPMEEIKFVE